MLGSNSCMILCILTRCISMPSVVGPCGREPEQAPVDPAAQVDSYGPHVAHDLVRRILRTRSTRTVRRGRRRHPGSGGQAGLTGSGRAGDQNAAAAVIAVASEHGIQRRNAGGDPLIGCSVLQVERSDRQNREPGASMRKGYSLVPCVEPRYLTTRMRRVKTVSITRLSSRITQSETYSSRPWRVRVPSPRSPVMTAVSFFSFSQRNNRRNSLRSNDRSQAPQTATRCCRAAPAWRRRNRWHGRGGQTGLPGHIRRLSSIRLRSRTRNRSQVSCSRPGRPNRSRARRRCARVPRRFPQRRCRRPGSSNSVAPRTRNSMPSRVFPQPGPPQTRVGRPLGRPPNVISSRP